MSRASILGLILVVGWAWAPGVAADPPGRVGRIDHSQGSVGYSPYGEADWIAVERNRPLVRGDRLWTDVDGRAEMQLGSAVLRMAAQTSLELLDLDDEIAQFEVTQGSINLSVPRVYNRQSYEIATPLLAFVVDRAGRYRVDVDPRRDETTIVVWEGSGEAYGENSRFSLRAGEAVRFNGTDLRRFQVMRLPRADAFDQYCIARDRIRSRSPSLRYVDDDLIGYTDLDEYGVWGDTREYGSVWYPRGVDASWAPYRDGRWVWQQPWGWTWVDDAPWGFAPMHYGRWARVNNRWGWIPGSRRTRAVFAPALVAFVGGSDWSLSMSSGGQSPVGWFPLGPREVYVPTYRASRSYFDRVNRHNTTVSDANFANLYTRYERGSGSIAQERYAHRGALTAVPGSVFTEARPVRGARLRLDPQAAMTGEVLRGLPMAPGPRSARGMAPTTRVRPDAAVLERTVYARHAVPARTDAVPLYDPGAREGQRQENRANAARDREQRGRGNVRLLQASEAQPNARREPLEPERTVDGQRQRTAQDQVQQQAEREMRRADQLEQDARDARRGDQLQQQAEREAQRADAGQRQAERDARRADEAQAAQTREREQAAAQQRDAAESQRQQVEAQDRAQRDAAQRQRQQIEAQDRQREQVNAQERAQREAAEREQVAAREQAAEREQAAAREQAQREAASQGEEAAAQQRGRLEAERQREQAAVQQRAEREAAEQQRAQEQAAERAAREAAQAANREAGDRGRGRNSAPAQAEPPPGQAGKPARGNGNGKDADDEEADEDKERKDKGKPDDGR